MDEATVRDSGKFPRLMGGLLSPYSPQRWANVKELEWGSDEIAHYPDDQSGQDPTE